MSETSDIAIPKKILIVRLGAMGDVIHAIPAVQFLANSIPEARIGWVIERRWQDLLRWETGKRRFPDNLHIIDTHLWRKNLLSRGIMRDIAATIREIRAQQYDVALDLQGAIKSAVIAALSGAMDRYGFANSWEKPSSLLYTHQVRTTHKHVVEKNFEVVDAVIRRKWPPTKDEDFLPFRPVLPFEDVFKKMSSLELSSRFAILNPGAGWGAKQWPLDRYAEVARALGEQGIRSLVNYGPGEEELARQVAQASAGHAVAATFTISELMVVICRAALFIGGDTGPMHLAAMSLVPVVAIFGPTDPARTGPYGTRSIVLRDPSSVTSHKRHRDTEAGLKNITTEQVLKAALELLQVNHEGVHA